MISKPVIFALSVRQIGKSFGSRKVLDSVSLDVASGEVVGLLGPNGAGKTICFYGIMGIIRPDGGQILLGGEDVTSLTMEGRAGRGLGYLPQEASIFRGMSVEENIRAVLELRERDPDIIRRRLDALLAKFSITPLRALSALATSGDERRRCEIARAMGAEPKVILLDEPFAGIDPMSIADIKAMVRDLKARGVAILITDHMSTKCSNSSTGPMSSMPAGYCLPARRRLSFTILTYGDSILARITRDDFNRTGRLANIH